MVSHEACNRFAIPVSADVESRLAVQADELSR